MNDVSNSVSSRIGVILSAGNGQRSGLEYPKQFFIYNNRSVIEYLIDTFDSCNNLDCFYIVISKEHQEKFNEILSKNNWGKFRGFILGGATRFESSKSAISFLEKRYNRDSIILLHDGARIFISLNLLELSIKAVENRECNVCTLAIDSYDTVATSSNGIFIDTYLERKNIKRVQTPQTFRLETISTAFNEFENNSFKKLEQIPTDDCSLILSVFPKEKIFIIPGNDKNIKLTTKTDFNLLLH